MKFTTDQVLGFNFQFSIRPHVQARLAYCYSKYSDMSAIALTDTLRNALVVSHSLQCPRCSFMIRCHMHKTILAIILFNKTCQGNVKKVVQSSFMFS